MTVPAASSQEPLKSASVDGKTSGILRPAVAARLAAGCWMLWATTLIGGTLISFREPETLPVSRDTFLLVSHLGSSLCLVAAAYLWFLGFSRSRAATTLALFAAGMVLGALGDFFNGGALQDLVPLPDPVLGGIAAFALGHICYILGCRRVARRLGVGSRARFWGAVLFWYFVVFRGARSGPSLLVWAALPYSLLLAGMTGLASSLALEDKRFFALALGGVLFLVSDLILAFRMFDGEFPNATHAVWLTYGPAQMLIVFSLGLIGRVASAQPGSVPNA